MKKTGWLILTGIAAGVLNGFLGTGGGIVIILALGYMRKKCGLSPVPNLSEKDEKSPQKGSSKDDYATAITAILPMSAVSLVSYWLGNSFDYKRALMYVVPGITGGLLGAFLLERISPKLLKRLFAVLMIISGVIMIARAR